MSDHHVCQLCGKSDHVDYLEHCTFPEPHWAHKRCLARSWENWNRNKQNGPSPGDPANWSPEYRRLFR